MFFNNFIDILCFYNDIEQMYKVFIKDFNFYLLINKKTNKIYYYDYELITQTDDISLVKWCNFSPQLFLLKKENNYYILIHNNFYMKVNFQVN